MADTKISALTAITGANLDVADLLAVVDTSATQTKNTTLNDIATWLQQTHGLPRTKKLTSQHSNSTISTGTKVTDLDMTLEAGTYKFDYRLFVRTATVTVSPMLGVNFSTGTVTTKNWHFNYADASATLLAAIGTIDDVGSTALGFGMRMAQNVFSTTTPNMGNTGSANAMATTTTDHLVTIEGLMIVTVQGNLELWHASETATATTVEVGSSLVVIRTA